MGILSCLFKTAKQAHIDDELAALEEAIHHSSFALTRSPDTISHTFKYTHCINQALFKKTNDSRLHFQLG
jgi:hypothetical protein